MGHAVNRQDEVIPRDSRADQENSGREDDDMRDQEPLVESHENIKEIANTISHLVRTDDLLRQNEKGRR